MENPYLNDLTEYKNWIESEDSRPLDLYELLTFSKEIINTKRRDLIIKINNILNENNLDEFKNRLVFDYVLNVLNFTFDNYNTNNEDLLSKKYEELIGIEKIKKLILNYYLFDYNKSDDTLSFKFVESVILNGRKYGIGLCSEFTMKKYSSIYDIIEDIYEYEYLLLTIDGKDYNIRFKYFNEDIMSFLIKVS